MDDINELSSNVYIHFKMDSGYSVSIVYSFSSMALWRIDYVLQGNYFLRHICMQRHETIDGQSATTT